MNNTNDPYAQNNQPQQPMQQQPQQPAQPQGQDGGGSRLRIDDNMLQSVGLGGLPPQEKNRLLAQIYETLELRVGMTLANQMTEAQLKEFEQFIEGNDEQGALGWLEANFPNYRQVVAQELEKLKVEVQQSSQAILDAVNNPQAQPSAQPNQAMTQPQQQSMPQSPNQYPQQPVHGQQPSHEQPHGQPHNQPHHPQRQQNPHDQNQQPPAAY
jgi:hypothetical protein